MRGITILSGIAGIFILWSSCVYNSSNPDPAELTIDLRWTKAYPTESKEKITTGLAWGLSFLGASLPMGAMNRTIYWRTNDRFTLDIKEAGFPEASLAKWAELIAALRASEEYTRTGGIDLGRFIALTMNSTNHYYAITGAHPKLSQFRTQYHFDERKAAVLKSTVAFDNRLIEIGLATRFEDIAFIAMEGQGSLANHTFQIAEYEAMNFMPNGQLRFALYDLNGNLKTATSPELSIAGKPAKCLWCHEINLAKPFQDYPAVEGYYNKEEFDASVEARRALIAAYRMSLQTEVNFSNLQDHTQMELLYLSFMEPSAARLAAEWQTSVEDVKQRLQVKPTHVNAEFAFLGDALYSRKDIDALAPYTSIRAADDARELSIYEPDIIHP